MSYTIIDAHAHLWLKQDAIVQGQKIQTLSNGQSLFMGEVRQMLPPFMTDGQNTAERFISNMNYARVTGAVITQEYIDGVQNDYLVQVAERYPDRFICCGMADMRTPGYLSKVAEIIDTGFKGIKVPAQRLVTQDLKVSLTSDEMMNTFKLMEKRKVFLSIDLADGDTQVAEMNEVISECPDLKIAIGHFGMVTKSGWQQQIKLACNKNVMIESGGITWLFNDEFYPFKGAIWAIKEAISLVGIEKLMWGSDYPRTIVAITYKMSYDFIEKSNLLTNEEKKMFLGENARRFYGFEAIHKLPYIKNMSE